MLPLIGGGVTLIAVAEPVSRNLMFEYRQWLAWEGVAVEEELHDGWSGMRNYLEEHRAFHVAQHLHGPGPRPESYTGANAVLRSNAYRWHHGAALPASTRAALVLSAVGCDWRERI